MRFIDKYSAVLHPKPFMPVVGDFTSKGIIQDHEMSAEEDVEFSRWRIADRLLRREDFKVFSLFLVEINPYGIHESLVPDYERVAEYRLTKAQFRQAFYSYRNFSPRKFKVILTDKSSYRYNKLCEALHKGRDFELRLGADFVVTRIGGDSDIVHPESYAMLIKLPENF